MGTPNWMRAIKRKMARETPGDTCWVCDGPSTEFRDALSKREHGMSGMCQSCQDIMYEPTPEPEEGEGKGGEDIIEEFMEALVEGGATRIDHAPGVTEFVYPAKEEPDA